jgi:Lon protease-like protein
VIRTGAVVTQTHRRIRADEDGAGVVHARRNGFRIGGLNLQVLGGVRIDHVEPLVNVVDEHDGALLTTERGLDALDVFGDGDLCLELLRHSISQLGAIGDEDTRRHRIVFGLADEVSCNMGCSGSAVGKNRDLGRSGFGVDPDAALEESLRRRDVDVPRPSHEIHGLARASTVREHRDRLRATDGVDLVDTKQRARRENAWVWQTAVLLLRWAGNGKAADAGGLRGYDVHDDAARIDGSATRHIETHAAYRHPAFGHRAAGNDLCCGVSASLICMNVPRPADRFLECFTNWWLEVCRGALQRFLRHRDVGDRDAIEPFRQLEQSRNTVIAYVVTNGTDDVEDGLDIGGRTRHKRAVIEIIWATASQVNAADHLAKSRSRNRLAFRRPHCERPAYCGEVPERLALFPLRTVVYPGLALQLHVFEERYRELVRDLVDLPEDEPKQFGVIAIRRGREVDAEEVPELHNVGCATVIRQLAAHADGRFDLETAGTRRFRLLSVDDTLHAYYAGEVEWLEEPLGDDAPVWAARVVKLFHDYRAALSGEEGADAQALPDDPLVLSYLVSAAVVLDLPEKQMLLAAPDAAVRLRMLASLLRRETALIGQLGALPAINLLRRRP